jgi:hypothetical protein
MGIVLGPEKINDTCMKVMHMGMMDRGITVVTFHTDHYTVCSVSLVQQAFIPSFPHDKSLETS